MTRESKVKGFNHRWMESEMKRDESGSDWLEDSLYPIVDEV